MYVRDFELDVEELPEPGHAKRSVEGVDSYGKKYLTEEHKLFLAELVDKGNKESSSKLQPAQMLHAIKDHFEDSFLLPSEYEVRMFIQQYLNRKPST